MSSTNTALKYDTQEKVNNYLKECSLEERVFFVQQEAANDNFVLLEYEPKGTPLTNTIEHIITQNYCQPKRINETGNHIHETTKQYYSTKKKEKDSTLDKAVESLFLTENSYQQIVKTDEEKELLKKTLKFILDTYGEAKHPLMKNKKNYTAEHSMHAAQLLITNKGATFTDVLTTLLHDWIEDRGLDKYTRGKETERIVQSANYVFKKLKTGNSTLDSKLLTSIAAMEKLTTRSWVDYSSNIGNITQFADGKSISNDEIITSALMTKLADKETGLLTWEPFDAAKKISTIGKTYLILDTTRQYIDERREYLSPKRLEALEKAVKQTSITLRRAIRKERGQVKEAIRIMKGEKKASIEQQGLGGNVLLYNKAVRKKLFSAYDRPSTKYENEESDFFRSLYVARVLGSNVDKEYVKISPTIMTEEELAMPPEEAQAQAFKRIREEKEKIEKTIPSRAKPTEKHKFINFSYDKELQIVPLRELPEKEQELEKLQKYSRRLLAYEGGTKNYFLRDDGFFYGRDVV